jgi:hypothetical protein
MECRKRDSYPQIEPEKEPPAKQSRLEDGQECTINDDSPVSVTNENDDVLINDANTSSVGITEYLGSHVGFYGSIKERWEDFLVHEISEDGNVVHLTSFELQTFPTPVVESNGSTADSHSLTDEILEKISAFVASDEECLRLPASDKKEDRCSFHATIRQNFQCWMPLLSS